MKLITDETVAHSSTNPLFSWGGVRRFIWETGNSDQPYLAVAVSTIVDSFGDTDGDADTSIDTVYVWAGYRTTSFYGTLESAQRIEPTVYDITHEISAEYSTRGEAEASAQRYLDSLRAEDFKPEAII